LQSMRDSSRAADVGCDATPRGVRIPRSFTTLRERSKPTKEVLVPIAAAQEYDGLQYGGLTLRANQRLQTRRGEHWYRRWAIRVFNCRRGKAPASVHYPNDSGVPFKRRPLPPFAD